MDIDLVGRVKNMPLSPANCLLPLFEAVVNSIQSIQSTGQTDGTVTVEVIRDTSRPTLTYTENEVRQAPIASFAINDNGRGFDADNFKAFCTSDTTYKQSLGGKGIGRFLWLKAFSRISIDSVFASDGRKQRRQFEFLLSAGGVCNESCVEVEDDTPISTRICLEKYQTRYEERCPKSPQVIAGRVLEHCLQYFVLGGCPDVTVRDEAERISLARLFSQGIQPATEEALFAIGGHDFMVKNLRLKAAHDTKHQVHYCAHKRVVRSEGLTTHIKDLPGSIKSEAGDPFVYAAYVSGDYLDQNVNADRTDFTISSSTDQLELDGLCWRELSESVARQAETYLQGFLEPVRAETEQRIRQFVEEREPQFRHLLNNEQTWVREIPADLPDDRLYAELSKRDHGVRLEMRESVNAMLQQDIAGDSERYSQTLSQLMEKVSEVGQADLARYVVHRRTVLDLLERSLQAGPDGRYRREEVVHSIIYPMRKSSSELESFEGQNLWMIDERLCYHAYLASDKKLSQMPVLENGSDGRPDIAVFNRRFAYAESDQPYSSVVIVEFKRPIRDDYTDEDNPINQVYDYVRDIRGGQQLDSNGRPFNTASGTRFYCYVIADLTEKLRKHAENAGLSDTPDGMGLFGINERVGAYIEIISFDKLLQDAKKRNRVLFDKLNLPQ